MCTTRSTVAIIEVGWSPHLFTCNLCKDYDDVMKRAAEAHEKGGESALEPEVGLGYSYFEYTAWRWRDRTILPISKQNMEQVKRTLLGWCFHDCEQCFEYPSWLVIAKQEGLFVDRNTKVSETIAEVEQTSEPYIAVSTVACFLEYQSIRCWLVAIGSVPGRGAAQKWKLQTLRE